MVSRANGERTGSCWPFGVREKFPVIGVPLRGDDADVPLDLGAVLKSVYDRAEYDRIVDYGGEPEPPLKAADAKWAKGLLRGHR